MRKILLGLRNPENIANYKVLLNEKKENALSRKIDPNYIYDAILHNLIQNCDNKHIHYSTERIKYTIFFCMGNTIL